MVKHNSSPKQRSAQRLSPISRKSRETMAVALRKARREEQLSKRRNLSVSEVRELGMEVGPAEGTEAPLTMATALLGIRSGDASRLERSVRWVRTQVSRVEGPPLDGLIEAGLVPVLAHLLRDTNSQVPASVRLDAAWALTNVASGTSEQTEAVVSAGCVALFVEGLGSPDSAMAEQCVWALGNVAGDSPALRDVVIQAGAVESVAPLLSSQTVSLARNATWAASNLCRGKPPPEMSSLRPLLGPLKEALMSGDAERMADAAWAFSYVADGPNDRIQEVVEADVVGVLSRLLTEPSPKLAAPALRALGNVVTGTDGQTQAVLDAGVLGRLGPLLTAPPKPLLRKEAVWLLSNVTAGNRDQIQQELLRYFEAVLDGGLLGPLVEVLSEGDYACRKEAAWALANLVDGGSPDQVRVIAPGIGGLCDLLTVSEAAVVSVALRALEGLLEAGDGGQPGANPSPTPSRSAAASTSSSSYRYRSTELSAPAPYMVQGLATRPAFQTHASTEVYVKALELIERHFAEEGDEEDAAAAFDPDAPQPFNPARAPPRPSPCLGTE